MKWLGNSFALLDLHVLRLLNVVIATCASGSLAVAHGQPSTVPFLQSTSWWPWEVLQIASLFGDWSLLLPFLLLCAPFLFWFYFFTVSVSNSADNPVKCVRKLFVKLWVKEQKRSDKGVSTQLLQHWCHQSTQWTRWCSSLLLMHFLFQQMTRIRGLMTNQYIFTILILRAGLVYFYLKVQEVLEEGKHTLIGKKKQQKSI